ncbi:MAG: alpha/beta hydrolase domain-containing protein [Acidimicrobiales bacterium]
MVTVAVASLSRPPAEGQPFAPTGAFRGTIEEFDYIEEEWFASGEVDGHAYTTSVFVRRPRDHSKFSGMVIVEPVHAASAAPVWIYTSLYQMRSGHGWAAVCSQKSPLDGFVKASSPERYASLEIWSDAPPLAGPLLGLPREPAARQARMDHMRRLNALSTPILAQVGAALAAGNGPFEGFDPRHVILTGHSQTGGVVTDYIVNGHDAQRHADGSPVYHGFFPTGAPSVQFGPRDVPIVQVLSDGDISDPNRWGREGRGYRRPDSDDPSDRYRLYELAGVSHMGTRYPPYSDIAMWQNDPIGTAGDVPKDATMNSLPHGQLFSMGLDHLVRWVADDVAPPRADRIESGPDGLFSKDECGNSRGGVRCAQIDVPRLTYLSNPSVGEDGVPAFGVVGIEEPLEPGRLEKLYRDHADYVSRFDKRVGALVDEGWLLPADADEMRAEAAAALVP